MGILMRVCGEGSANDGARRGATGSALLLALLVPVGSLGLLGGCANGSSNADTRVAVQVEPAKPEQVVQRIEPAPDPEPATAPLGNGAAPGTPDKRTPVKGGSISARHLEAELNRLEAELK